MKRNINILFLGGAKRVSMARKFKDAAAARGLCCGIFSYEMSLAEAIACEATVIEGLKWKDPEADADLRRVIAENSIDIVIPFVDGAVAPAARLRDVAFVPAGSAENAALMFDKIRAAEAFEREGLPIPATYHPGDPCMRLIAKPRFGSASQGIVEINSLDVLDRFLDRADDYMIQERIDNREEYTVDCYVRTDSGEILTVSPRRRLQVSGGEVTKTVTVDSPRLVELTRLAITRLDLRGAVTVQFMRDTDDDRLLLMEINPRLGGGAVCSVCAGADLPGMIIDEALGREACPSEAQPGVFIARYQDETVFYPEKK